MKKIGIITSGGDCGGLNSVIKGAAKTALSMGMEVVVIPNGYAGLYNLLEMDSLVTLTQVRLDAFDGTKSGSEAGHSRVKIKKIDNAAKYDRIKDGLRKFSIEGLVISGGDDTGSVIVDLSSKGIPCVHVPKTMDLDLQTYSVGGDSTINRIAMLARDLKTTGRSHNRVLVMEVFGRYAGHSAFRGGLAAEADCILIPEIPADFDIVYEHVKRVFTGRVQRSDVHAGTYLVIVAEGLTDAKGEALADESAGKDSFGHVKLSGAGKYVRKQLESRLKADPEIVEFMKGVGMFVKGLNESPEVREVNPGHIVRSGYSSAYDVVFGLRGGAAGVTLLAKGMTGVTVVNVDGTDISYVPTKDAIKQRHVDISEVSLFEAMDVCFGREPEAYEPKPSEHKGGITRYM